MEREPIDRREVTPMPLSPEALRARLSSILSQSLTVDNVETFGETMVNALIELSGEVVARYQREQPDDAGAGKALEDRAFAAYVLDDLGLYLERAGEKAEMLRRIQTFLSQVDVIPEIITPPDEMARPVLAGRGGFPEEKRLVPRLELLLYILENDLGYTRKTSASRAVL